DQLDTYHQRILDDAALDHRCPDRQPVHETGAGGVDIERRRAGRADALLYAGGAVRDRLVVAAAAIDDELDVLAAHAGAGDRAACRGDRELDAGHVRDAPLLHTGPRPDPLIVRRQECGQVVIREDGWR